MSLRRLLQVVWVGIWLLVQLCLPVGLVHSEIYRWKDSQGNWHFSDSPPSDAPITQPPEPEWQSPAPPADQPPPAASAPTDSADSAEAPKADLQTAPSARQGLLWRIKMDGKAAGYLLGTIHSSDRRVTNLRTAVAQALDRSDRFVMEMEMDASALTSFGSSMMLPSGQDLESLLGAALYKEVQSAMTAYGMPAEVIRQLKPWVVMALLSMPKPDGGLILDLVLQQRAAAAGKPTTGLETAEEQLAVFEQLSMSDQIDLLKMTLAQLPTLPKVMEQLIQAYAADDLKQIAALADNYKNQGNTDVLKRFTFRLNDERNQRMTQRMKPYLQQGNSFIAVGAMHLAGPKGIVQLLRQAGYQVESVP
ncbi:MAG: TraB/GumN family protein [Desulfobacteraceae bacterium]|nr:TraB/GumN family protein [Desulfobacteraceae bacterium]